jgi:uncharacterized membrane protein
VAEDDEDAHDVTSTQAGAVAEDNSLGRLLTLSDGIFAIAMTLLALDLTVPDNVGDKQGETTLTHALAMHSSSYLSFLLSFYVVTNYWLRHRQLMRSVVMIHPVLIRHTLFLLVIVAAMPFPTSLLGRYGSQPISLAIYGAINVLAVITLMLLSRDIEQLHLGDDRAEVYVRRWQSWLTLGVFALCIPAGYVAGHYGPYVLILLAIPNRVVWLLRLVKRLLRQ